MILLFTDFGADRLYLGQVEAVLRALAPGVPVIDAFNDAPSARPDLASYLLAPLVRQYPQGSVFLCVVDPGVGGKRLPVVLEADGRWFVGPANGLLDGVAQTSATTSWRIIRWRPDRLSASFHGRDLFAPIAARIALNDFTWTNDIAEAPDLSARPNDLAAIVYCDHYGNACTGWRYQPTLEGQVLQVGGHRLVQATTFGDVPVGHAFWYCNSLGLVEIAVNQGRADRLLGLVPGMTICFP